MVAILTVTMNPSVDISMNADEIVPYRKLRCTHVSRDPGGGGVNVARVISRLGGDCLALFPAGGPNGRQLIRLLEGEKVTCAPIEVAAETRENLTVVEETTGRPFRFVLPGALLLTAEWGACLDWIESRSAAPAYIVASGSLPPGVPTDFYVRIGRIARARGARIVVDTSGPALAAALDGGVYIVKPNLRELRLLTGSPLSTEADQLAAAREIVKTGKAEIVVLTLAEDGALLVSREIALRAAGVPVQVVNPVGAGDSFLAGFLWRLSAGAGLPDAFRYGVAAGTAALLTPGTELCRPADVERIVRQVEMRPVGST